MGKTDPAVFDLFHHALLRGAPLGYTPHYIALEPNGKDPCKGFSWKQQPLTFEEAKRRLEQGGNVGISARVGDPLVIVDIDDITATPIETVKETLTAKSRKRLGLHLFYMNVGGEKPPNIPTDAHGEVRSQDQYVVAPGSYVPVSEEELARIPESDRENAGRYTLELVRPPTKITLEELPSVFLDQYYKGRAGEETAHRLNQTEEFKPHPAMSPLFKLTFKDVCPGVPVGVRVSHPFHESDTGHNFMISGTLAHCWRHNVSLNPGQLLAVKAGLLSCLDAGTSHRNAGAGPSKLTGNEELLQKLFDYAVKEGLVKETDKRPGAKKEPAARGGGTDRSFDPKPCAEHLMQKYTFATFEDTKEIYVCQDGMFAARGEAVILADTQVYLLEEEEKATRFKANEVVGFVQRSSFILRSLFGGALGLVNIENGVLNIETGELLPHSPEYRFLVKLPVNYDPKATCPQTMKFLSEILRPEDLPTLQEAVGYCLLREYRYHKAFMFAGKGGNGKSKLLGLVQALLGRENCSSASLQSIAYNRFASAELYGKMANVCADIPSSRITSSGMFKMLTGGDMITAERKGCDPFQYTNFAKLFFSANAVPATTDDSNAYYDRWVIFDFPNVFRGTDRDDPKILERLTTPGELSGFLNWALVGLRRLLTNNRFSNNKTTDEVRDDYIKRSDPEKAFAMDCLIADLDGTIPKDTLYSVYVGYCDRNRLQKMSITPFFRDVLPRVFGGVKRVRLGGKGNRYYAIQGIRLRTPEDAEEEVEPVSGILDGSQTPPDEQDQKTLECVQDVWDTLVQDILPLKTAKEIPTNSREKEGEGVEGECKNKGVYTLNSATPDNPDTKQQKHRLKTILFTKEYPAFVGADGKTYGSFITQDTASVPEKNAQIITLQGAATYVDFQVEPQGQYLTAGHAGASTPQHDRLTAVYEIVRGIGQEKETVPVAEVIREANRRLGVGTLEVEQALEKLKMDGLIFEPHQGEYELPPDKSGGFLHQRRGLREPFGLP